MLHREKKRYNESMKVTINTDDKYGETEIIVNCCRMSEKLKNLLNEIQELDQILEAKLTGRKDKRQYILEAANVIYIESVDNRTFIYTSTDVYESSLKLYELEENLSGMDFMRASKNCLFNFKHIQYIEPELDRRYILFMKNGAEIVVSRHYSAVVKKKLEDSYE